MVALDIDVALAERARHDAWTDAFDGDTPDFFASALRLMMDMVKG